MISDWCKDCDSFLVTGSCYGAFIASYMLPITSQQSLVRSNCPS